VHEVFAVMALFNRPDSFQQRQPACHSMLWLVGC
jgi:hypothetical protein